MIGRKEAEIKQLIETELRALPEAIEPNEVFEHVATAVARAITKNNEAIEIHLKQLIRRAIIRNNQTITANIRQMVSTLR